MLDYVVDPTAAIGCVDGQVLEGVLIGSVTGICRISRLELIASHRMRGCQTRIRCITLCVYVVAIHVERYVRIRIVRDATTEELLDGELARVTTVDVTQ